MIYILIISSVTTYPASLQERKSILPRIVFPHANCLFLPLISGAGVNGNQTTRHQLYRRSDSDESIGTICEPSTDTFIVVSFHSANSAVPSLLATALQEVQGRISGGPIPAAGWRYLGRRSTSIKVYSQPGQRTTYKVLHSAIQALIFWMSRPQRDFGTCDFSVWDGDTMVGRGNIAAPPF